MIAIIDYGVGNLFSLVSSFRAIGADAVVSSDPEVIRTADRLVLPGVGAFQDAAEKLKGSGLSDLIVEKAGGGTPMLGVCLGMQLLFEKSYEYGEFNGLGLIPGTVRAMKEILPDNLKIPHMGWNPLILKTKEHPLFREIKEGDAVYFVHSYSARNCEENTLATAEYGTEIVAAVGRRNIVGCQFHPEKSGDVGLRILRGFCKMEGQS